MSAFIEMNTNHLKFQKIEKGDFEKCLFFSYYILIFLPVFG